MEEVFHRALLRMAKVVGVAAVSVVKVVHQREEKGVISSSNGTPVIRLNSA